MRRSGRIVSVAAIVAVAVNLDGRREVLGIAVQPSEAEVFWDEFLRSLADRGLRGTRLIIADDHKGLKAAAAKVLGATVQRCRVHFMRNALACVGKKDRPIVTAALRTAFDQCLCFFPMWCCVCPFVCPYHQHIASRRDSASRRYRASI